MAQSGLLLLAGVLLIGVLPAVLLYRLRKPSWKLGDQAPVATPPQTKTPARHVGGPSYERA